MQSGRGFEYGVHHLLSPRTGLISEIMSEKIQLDAKESQELLRFGAVYHKHIRITQDQMILEGDLIRVHTKPRRFLRKVDWSKLCVVENNDYLIIDKPAGLPCHPTVDNLHENILTQLSEHLGQKLFLTHRLDLPTSGLLLFAKSESAQSHFNKSLHQSEVQKIYEATVEGIGPELGRHEHYMIQSPRAPKRLTNAAQFDTKNCILHILKKEIFAGQARLKIQLETGRTHQIRAQLSYLGFPIVGDTMYGSLFKLNKEWDEINLRAIELNWSELSAKL